VRMERGFLASAAEGPLNRATAVDFEECLLLGGTDVRDDEVVGTLLALAGYYFAIGDLPRSARVLTSLRVGMTPSGTSSGPRSKPASASRRG